MGKKFKLRCNENGVDSCPSFTSQKKLSLKKTKEVKPKLKKVEETVGGTHMNVRDISRNPGDVKPQASSAGESYTPTQERQSMASETKIGKMKLSLKKKKK